jgi:hypothetical protein
MKYYIILFLFLSMRSYSQSTMFQLKLDFTKSVDQPGNIINTTDGGYVVCGTLKHSNVMYPFLVKITSYGQEEWRSSFEISNLSTTCHYVLQIADGGFLLIGEIYVTAQNSDILIIRTDSMGNHLWSKSYGGSLADFGNNLVQLPSGNILICGESNLPVKTGIIIRIDINGVVLEENYFSVRFANSTIRGKLNGPNQVIVTGAGINELYTDTSGIYLGESNIALPDSVNTEDVIVTVSGKHFTIGNMYMGSSTGHQLYILSTDSTGSQSPSWIEKYGANGIPVSVYSKTIVPSSGGGIVIAGSVYQAFGFPGWLHLLAIDSTGSVIWDRAYSPNIYGFRTGGVTTTIDGGYILSGSGYDGNSKYDLYIIKTDSGGVSGCFEGSLPYPTYSGSYTNVSQQTFINDSLQNIGTSHSAVSSNGGSFNVLCYTSINESTTSLALSLFPNPFYEHLELISEATGSTNLSLDFFNMLGELVLTSVSNNGKWSDSRIKSLPSGIFIIELRSNSSVLGRFKMIHSIKM